MTNEGRLNAQFFMNTKFFQNHSAGMLQKKGPKVSRIISDHNMGIKIWNYCEIKTKMSNKDKIIW